jgi:hypothetical protein
MKTLKKLSSYKNGNIVLKLQHLFQIKLVKFPTIYSSPPNLGGKAKSCPEMSCVIKT